MTRFVDEYAPEDMPSWPCASSPRFSTQIVQVDSGDDQINQRWEHPLYRFTMPEVIREQDTFEAVRDQWLAMRGPAHTWPWRDPLDFATVALDFPTVVPSLTRNDQLIAFGDGLTRQFQLTKTYARGSQTYVRNITLPVIDTVLIAVDGADPNTTSPDNPWSVSRPGGILTFEHAPINGAEITWGGLFDVEVRFENDEAFEGIVQSYAVSGYASLTLVEVRTCEGAS